MAWLWHRSTTELNSGVSVKGKGERGGGKDFHEILKIFPLNLPNLL